MAERVIRQIIDDIDKSEIAAGEGERIEFTFRGVAYQLDLSNANVAKLEKALAPYIDAATSASSGTEGSTSAAAERPSPRRRRAAKKTAKRNRRLIARSGKEQLAAIRAWASENGYSVSARGRIPAGVDDAPISFRKWLPPFGIRPRASVQITHGVAAVSPGTHRCPGADRRCCVQG